MLPRGTQEAQSTKQVLVNTLFCRSAKGKARGLLTPETGSKRKLVFSSCSALVTDTEISFVSLGLPMTEL